MLGVLRLVTSLLLLLSPIWMCLAHEAAERPRVRRATESFEAKHTFDQVSFVENYKKEYYIANERWPDQADVTHALDAKVREHVQSAIRTQYGGIAPAIISVILLKSPQEKQRFKQEGAEVFLSREPASLSVGTSSFGDQLYDTRHEYDVAEYSTRGGTVTLANVKRGKVRYGTNSRRVVNHLESVPNGQVLSGLQPNMAKLRLTPKDRKRIKKNRARQEAAKDHSPSTTGRDRSPSTTGRDRSPSTTGRDRSPSTTGRDRSPSTTGRDRSPSTTGRDRSPSMTGRDRSPSMTGRDRSPSTTGRDRSPSTTGRDRTPSTTGRDRSPSTNGRDRSPSKNGRDRSPSPDRHSSTSGRSSSKESAESCWGRFCRRVGTIAGTIRDRVIGTRPNGGSSTGSMRGSSGSTRDSSGSRRGSSGSTRSRTGSTRGTSGSMRRRIGSG